ncbi:MAG: LSm family protein [Acidilobus sp.]
MTAQAERVNTFKVMSEYLNNNVYVKLKGGLSIKGVLKSFDQHLNLILDNAEEVTDKGSRALGTILVRGDSVVAISPAK